VAALLIAPAIQASTIDFTTGSITGSGFGNYIQVSDGTVTARLTGWSASNLTTDFTASQIKLWPTGVGTCSSGEGLNCPSGPHTVDNDGRKEVLLIQFSEPVIPTSASIAAWARDFDASYWGGMGTPDMDEMNFGDLGTRFNDPFLPNNAPSNGSLSRTVLFTSILTPVDWLAFGPPPSANDAYIDKFKFKSVSFIVPEEDAPEPGTLLLVGIGTALLAVGSRKRRQA
jgi:hypothetical protein